MLPWTTQRERMEIERAIARGVMWGLVRFVGLIAVVLLVAAAFLAIGGFFKSWFMTGEPPIKIHL